MDNLKARFTYFIETITSITNINEKLPGIKLHLFRKDSIIGGSVIECPFINKIHL